jgi:hypothetical protein
LVNKVIDKESFVEVFSDVLLHVESMNFKPITEDAIPSLVDRLNDLDTTMQAESNMIKYAAMATDYVFLASKIAGSKFDDGTLVTDDIVGFAIFDTHATNRHPTIVIDEVFDTLKASLIKLSELITMRISFEMRSVTYNDAELSAIVKALSEKNINATIESNDHGVYAYTDQLVLVNIVNSGKYTFECALNEHFDTKSC